MKVWALALAWGGLSGTASAAFVNLTLYNTYALLDFDQVTPLSGSAGSGDLVQVVRAGGNAAIDVPDVDGQPGGDDVLLPVTMANNPTHVGAGLPGSNHGLLYQINLVYDDSLAGSLAFVRFWNGGQLWTATHYGQTALFALPGGDAFGNAEYDFMSLAATAGRSTTVAFTADVPMVPEPRLFVFGVACLGLLVLWRRATAEPGEAGRA